MLSLNDDLLINTGTNRACFFHPFDNTKCIKIDIKKNKETKREKKYYKILQKNKTPFDMIANYYGTVYTNKGQGEVFELIRDYNGKVSQELDKFLNDKNLSETEILEVIENIFLLKKYLFKNKIYVKDLNPVNVIFQKISKDKSRLVIIDGLAHSNYNPFFYLIDSFLLKKIYKSWEYFFNTLEQKISSNNKKLVEKLKERNI